MEKLVKTQGTLGKWGIDGLLNLIWLNYCTSCQVEAKEIIRLRSTNNRREKWFYHYLISYRVEILLWFNIGSGKTLGTLLFPVSSTVKSLTCYVDYPGPCE